jgi:hypothetical protein
MGPDTRRRRHGRLLVAALTLLLPVATLLSGTVGYVPIALVPAVMLIPPMLIGRRPPPPGPSEPDDSGGDGGSRRPDGPSGHPGGGLPLLPATQPANRRYRGTPRTTLIPPRPRRPAREPERPRVPVRAR